MDGQVLHTGLHLFINTRMPKSDNRVGSVLIRKKMQQKTFDLENMGLQPVTSPEMESTNGGLMMLTLLLTVGAAGFYLGASEGSATRERLSSQCI